MASQPDSRIFWDGVSGSADEKGMPLACSMTHERKSLTPLSDRGAFLFRLGLTTIAAFLALLLPFLHSPALLLQVAHRVFPFARGLFEDKVANAWCALNVVVKLRDVADTTTLARLALAATLVAVLPGVLGMLWVSYKAGQPDGSTAAAASSPVAGSTTTTYNERSAQAESSGLNDDDNKAREPPPTAVLLPHALFTSAMAFFLFAFQVHEKGILVPLMPLTVLMGAREAGYGRMDWEWAVLLNNVGTFRYTFVPPFDLACPALLI